MKKPSRRIVRILLLVIAVPVFAVSLVVALKLASLQVIGGIAISRYEVGAFESSAETAEDLLENNLFEPWIAHFDRGTALASAGLFNESIDDLERAFDLAPDDRQCDVARNLSLAWESLGDQYVEQGQFAGALKLYDLARAALDAAGEDCGSADDGDRADPDTPQGVPEPDPRSRLDDKKTRAQELEAQAERLTSPQGRGSLDELQEQQGDAAEEKGRQERLRDEVAPAPQGGTGKPW